ncbi:hypothetical protein V5F72_04175 [Xanthobacter flavus]|uniref:hypothetical protein n=1 Tax=Xanthobacter flavus TaxID=281 RepID=UPI0037265E1C
MAAPRPAARVTIAILSAYVLVLQLLLAGLAGGAVAGTGEGTLCAVSAARADGGGASGHAISADDCCIGACLVLDALEGAPPPAPYLPEGHAAPGRESGDGVTVRLAPGRPLPPARAPPA